MLGSLSLMACTLMLAAVPSLSPSLSSREENYLPAIAYAMSDDVRVGVNPLGDETYRLNSSLTTGFTVMGSLADQSTVADLSSDDPFCAFTFNDWNGLDILDPSSTSHSSTLIVLSVLETSTSAHLYLPDLTYWTYREGTYYLDVFVTSADDELYSVYGNTLDGTTLSYSLAELGDDVNPIGAIGDGLGIVGALGGALSDGFDGVFLSDGALTAVGTFSFVLLGIGVSVGICKKCFNWVTGRHGM